MWWFPVIGSPVLRRGAVRERLVLPVGYLCGPRRAGPRAVGGGEM